MRYALLFLLVALLPLAAAEDIVVNMSEHGKITSYLDTYWVVNVNGTGTIHNPSDGDLYDVRLYFDIVGLDLIDHGGDGYFDEERLIFDSIPGGATRTFSYQIVGISAEPPTLAGKGVLYTGLAKRNPRIYSDVFGELQKAPLEDPSLTGRNARLISVTLSNPTGFQFTIESLRVIKTSGLNPNQARAEWRLVNATAPRIMDPDGFYVDDILDKDAAEGEVYWLQSEVYISKVFLDDTSNISRFTEQNLTVPIEELNFTNQTGNDTLSLLEQGYALRKTISERVAVPGEPVTVVLALHNFGDTLQDYVLTDAIPAGFTASTELSWTGEVPARGTIVQEYRAVLNDTESAGIDRYPRARASIDGKTIYSPEVPFIRQFIPDDRVYVQKRVSYRDDDSVMVRIEVQNLGRNPLVGATLKELLSEEELFSEISVQPTSKGVWEVPQVLPGERWEVSYVTEEGRSISNLPVLYGLDSRSVLRSIVLENVVNEPWEFVRTNGIEIAGVSLLLGLPALFYFGRRKHWF